MKINHSSNTGFTLVELLVTTFVLAFVLAGLVLIFVRCAMLTDLTRNKTMAVSEAMIKIEEIREHDFSQVVADYNGTSFPLSQLTGWGFIYASETPAGLIDLEVVVGWQNKNGRIIGEDLDLNGTFDAVTEDTDGNGKMSSLVTLVSRVADRS